MPFCPTCGKYVEDGVEYCTCGTKFIISEEKLMQKKFEDEERLVLEFREYEELAIKALDDKDYEKALHYANMGLNLNLGSDASVKYIRGKSLFYLKRYYESMVCFKEYINEYKESLYRFANISGAYVWKARSLWELGDGFGSIKSYYEAIDFLDRKASSAQDNDLRFKIMDERQQAIYSSNEPGITNPKLGKMDYETLEHIERLDEDKNLTMQRLYDAIDEVVEEGLEYKSIKLKGDQIIVIFESEDGTVEKEFNGFHII